MKYTPNQLKPLEWTLLEKLGPRKTRYENNEIFFSGNNEVSIDISSLDGFSELTLQDYYTIYRYNHNLAFELLTSALRLLIRLLRLSEENASDAFYDYNERIFWDSSSSIFSEIGGNIEHEYALHLLMSDLFSFHHIKAPIPDKLSQKYHAFSMRSFAKKVMLLKDEADAFDLSDPCFEICKEENWNIQPQSNKWPGQDRFIKLLALLESVSLHFPEHDYLKSIVKPDNNQTHCQLLPFRLDKRSYRSDVPVKFGLSKQFVEEHKGPDCYEINIDGKTTLMIVETDFRISLQGKRELRWGGLDRLYVEKLNTIPPKSFMEKLNYFLTNEVPAQIKLAEQVLCEVPDPATQQSEEGRVAPVSVFVEGSANCNESHLNANNVGV